MFRIPPVFRNNNEDYIVYNSLIQFLQKNNVGIKFSYERIELIKLVESYASQSNENKEKVLDWIDNLLIEGIKEIYVRRVLISEYNKTYDDIKVKLEQLMESGSNRHICTEIDNYTEDYKIARYDIDRQNEIVRIYYCKKIHIKGRGQEPKVDWYPLIVEVDFDNGLIIGRAKSRTSMYKYMEQGFNYEHNEILTTMKEIKNQMQYTLSILEMEYENQEVSTTYFRRCFYSMLKKYTQTPDIIKKYMDNKQNEINTIVDDILNKICCINKEYENGLKFDISNLIEKYFSISYDDKSIFMKGRDAYPLRIKATDEEDSIMDQRTAVEIPLQSKEIFFDNKKMLQKSGMCDEMDFMFYKVGNTEKSFKVTISVNKGFFILKFRTYTREVDIQNVLSSIIKA